MMLLSNKTINAKILSIYDFGDYGMELMRGFSTARYYMAMFLIRKGQS